MKKLLNNILEIFLTGLAVLGSAFLAIIIVYFTMYGLYLISPVLMVIFLVALGIFFVGFIIWMGHNG